MAEPAPSPGTLHAFFAARGATMLDLGTGASTPARFADPRQEHLATRRDAGLFDFSFMSRFSVRGPQAVDFLEAAQTRDPRRLRPGEIAYSLVCREDGTVLNDATVWRHGEGHWSLFTGRVSDGTHLSSLAACFDVGLTEHSAETAVFAVQGPRSGEVLQRCAARFAPIGYFRFVGTSVAGADCLVARLGYSGEAGYEIVAPRAQGPAVWEALVGAGAGCGMAECGFEAADSLRIEAGHILFTRELASPVNPFELGFGRLLSARGGYLGEAALVPLRWRPPARRLVGLVPERWQGQDGGAGIVTSAAYSPTFGRMLALGFVPWDERHPGTRIGLPGGAGARVSRLPFYDPPKARPRG